MAKRPRHAQSESFGSDSFLDIVANIVGILIILIVMVGVRVKNAPVQTPEPDHRKVEAEQELQKKEHQRQLDEYQRQRDVIEEENQKRQEAYQQALALREEKLAEHARLAQQNREDHKLATEKLATRMREIQKRNQLQQSINADAASKKQTLAALEQDIEQARQQATLRDQKQRKLQEQLNQASGELWDFTKRAESALVTVKEQQSEWLGLKNRAEAFQQEIERLDNRPRPTSAQWVHYPAPVAKVVKQKEAQFRCKNGRIAYTYLDELLTQVEQKADVRTLLRRPLLQGTVGPEGGFKLSYTIIRATQSLNMQVRVPYSVGAQLSSFELLPESNELGETQEQALAEGSEFQAFLKTRPPRIYTITLWVYPDSFKLAKSVSDSLHKRGYEVALRPLLDHLPIAGSPQGSASQAQ